MFFFFFLVFSGVKGKGRGSAEVLSPCHGGRTKYATATMLTMLVFPLKYISRGCDRGKPSREAPGCGLLGRPAKLVVV